MSHTVEALVDRAQAGDSEALHEIVRLIQNQVYGLCLRMLWGPSDAEDAMQEILVKVITNLGSFRHESSFSTWVYRISTNHMLTARQQSSNRREISFDTYESIFDDMPPTNTISEATPYDDLIVREVMLACTQGVLQCLKPDLRIAYILGEVLQVPSTEASHILEINPPTFRQRLSRARTLIRDYMVRNCSLVNEAAPCTCLKEVDRSIRAKYVNPNRPRFATHPVTDEGPTDRPDAFADDFARVAALFRSHPQYAAPLKFLKKVHELVSQPASECTTLLRHETH